MSNVKEKIDWNAALASAWKYTRAEDRRKARKDPAWFAERMAKQFTRGWAFLLSKDPIKRAAQEAAHAELMKEIRWEALAFLDRVVD